MVVKGSFSGTAGGRRLRTLLLGFQFTISLGLIVATGFILLQHNFMLRQEMGFDRRNMMAVQLSEKAALGYDACATGCSPTRAWSMLREPKPSGKCQQNVVGSSI